MPVNEKQIGGDHYKSSYEHWDFTMDCNLNYLQGCATKYIARAYKKGGKEDFEKAIHYLEKQIEGGYAIVLHSGQVKHIQRFVRENSLGRVEAAAIWAVVSGEFATAIDEVYRLIHLHSKLKQRDQPSAD